MHPACLHQDRQFQSLRLWRFRLRSRGVLPAAGGQKVRDSSLSPSRDEGLLRVTIKTALGGKARMTDRDARPARRRPTASARNRDKAGSKSRRREHDAVPEIATIKDRAARGDYDAVIVGAGPNGLAAAIFLAQKGLSTLVVEARETVGGGARSGELTLPGFTHDICSAIHPMAMASPFFRSLPLHAHGLEWIHAPYPLAHPFDDGTAAVLKPALEETCRELGSDGEGYRKLAGPLAENWAGIEEMIWRPLSVPRDLALGVRFALQAAQPATWTAKAKFKTERARALFGGLAAHSVRPLESAGTAAIGLVLAAQAHAGGWPIPRGGAQRIVDALAGHLRSLGGEIATGVKVRSRRELPESRLLLCDVSPKGLLEIAGKEFPASYCRALRRYRYRPGV